MTVINNKKKKRLATMSLILCTFFNPFGFDALFALVMKWTGSYWTTDIIFYCVSFLFFVIYVLLSPETKSKIIRYKSKLKNIYM